MKDFPLKRGKRQNIPLCLPQEVAEKIAAAAEEIGSSKSAVMRGAIEVGLPGYLRACKAFRLSLDGGDK